MAKLTTDPIGSFTQAAVTTINTNFDRVEAALENTLSRDGTTPNQMGADIDMNQNDIINVDNIHTDTLVLGGVTVFPETVTQTGALLKINNLSDLSDVNVALNNLKFPTIQSGDSGKQLYVKSDLSGYELLGAAGPFINPTDFNVVGDLVGTTGTDQTANLQSMFNTIPSGSIVDFGSMQIYHSGPISINKDIHFIGNGWKIYGDAARITVAGTQSSLTDISVVATKGDTSITVTSGTGISAGDLLILHNTIPQSLYGNSVDSRDYQDGEFIEVQSVISNTITFHTRLKTSYPAAITSKVFKITPVKFSAKGGTIESTDSFAFQLQRVSNFDLDIDVIGGTTRAIYIFQCYKGNIRGGRYVHTAAAVGNNYGISLANSQDIFIHPNVFAFGTRHGISMGGAPGDACVPCRNIVAYKTRISSSTDGIHAADIHGWAVDCYYIDCDIDGTLGIGGLNCGAPYSRVIHWHSTATKPIALTEIVGGTIDLRNMKVSFASGSAALTAFGVAASSQFGGGIGVQNYDILLDGLDIDCTSNITSIASVFHNMPGTIKWTFSMDNVVLRGNISSITNILFLTFSNTLGHGSPPIRADYISQNGITHRGVGSLTASILIPNLSGIWTGCRWNLNTWYESNANGTVTLLPDGTMEATFLHSIAATAIGTAFLGGFRSGALTWTFPVVFNANPICFGIGAGNAFSICQSSVSTTTFTFFYTAVTSQAAATLVGNLNARGRYMPA